jgi:lia operon protein LiaG
MKTTKLFTTLLALSLVCQLPASAQQNDAKALARIDERGMRPIRNDDQTKEFKFKVPGAPEQYSLKITNLQTDISIEAYSGSEIVITALDFEGIPEKAAGLKPLSATGPDNTELGLNIKTEGNVIVLAGAGRIANDAEYLIKMPAAMGLSYLQDTWHGGGDFVVKGVNGEINIEMKNSDVVLNDVGGPVVASSVSGDINVVFTKLNQTKPTSLAATSGDIDVTLPADTKVNFKLSVVSGEIYTDLDLKFPEKEGMKSWGGMNANPTFNGSGVEVSLRAVSGDIFLRKK